MEQKLKEFLGERISYDPDGQTIWSVDKDGGLQMIANVRGWGAIQNMFDTQKEATAFQDSLGQFISDAINEKIERESNHLEIDIKSCFIQLIALKRHKDKKGKTDWYQKTQPIVWKRAFDLLKEIDNQERINRIMQKITDSYENESFEETEKRINGYLSQIFKSENIKE